MHQKRFLLLTGLSLFLVACSLLNFGADEEIEPGTPTDDPLATIAALSTANAMLVERLSTTQAEPTALVVPGPTVTPEPFAPPLPPPIITPGATIILPPEIATLQPVVVVLPRHTPTPTPVRSTWQVRRVMFSPKLPHRLYAFQYNQSDSKYRLQASNDYGYTWQVVATAWPVEDKCLNSLDLDANAPDHFYASTCRGLFYWSGSDWVFVDTKVTGMVATVPEEPRTRWATEPYGPADVPVTQDVSATHTWTPASRYLEHTNGVARLLFDPIDSERLYGVVWPGYPGSYLRRGSANGQWATLPTPLNNSPIDTNLVVDGRNGMLYALVNHQTLWRSPNPNQPNPEAIGWEPVHDFGADHQAELVGGSWRANDLSLFVTLTGANRSATPLLHRSTDGGLNWSGVTID